jgi:hypothetical protein
MKTRTRRSQAVTNGVRHDIFCYNPATLFLVDQPWHAFPVTLSVNVRPNTPTL